MQELEHTYDNTAKFMMFIKDTIIHGKINAQGYYEWAGFKFRNKAYLITVNDAILTCVTKANDGHIALRLASRKINKDGERERYVFAVSNMPEFDTRQISVECSRLNAALLIPGAFEKLVKDKTVEVNHKATMVTPYTKQAINTANVAMNRYIHLINAGLSDDAATRVLSKEYKDIVAYVYMVTCGFKHHAAYPRDNRVTNLELCTSYQNKAHYRAVREFISLSTDPNYEYKEDFSLKPVEAEVAERYTRGTMTRDEFIEYLIGLTPISTYESYSTNFPTRVSQYIEDLVSTDAIKAWL